VAGHTSNFAFTTLVEAVVYRWDILVLLKHFLEEGLTNTAIAERLSMDRKTVGRWITGGMVDTVGELERPPRVRMGRPFNSA
jgi:hypothetical protein